MVNIKKINYLHEKTTKKISILTQQGNSYQNKWRNDTYKNNFVKNSKKLEKWNFSIFIKNLQKAEEKIKNKNEQSFAELYEVKRVNFQEKLKTLFKIEDFL